MAALVLLSIIAFVVTPIMTYVMQGNRSAGRSSNGVLQGTLVQWRGGSVDSQQYELMNRKSRMAYDVLLQMSQEVQKAGGKPQIPRGIATPGGLENIHRRMMNQKAKEMGIVVDDSMVDEFLRQFVDGRINNRRLNELIRERGTSDYPFTRFDLYEFIKESVAASLVQELALSGYADEQGSMFTPGRNWQLFLRFNQRQKVEVFPVLTDDMLAKVTQEPSSDEIKKLYEAGSNRYANKYLPDPGFRQPYQSDIEYVGVNIEDFINAERAKLTEEQIQANYQKLLGEGRYKVPDTTSTPAAAPNSPTNSPSAPESNPESTSPAPAPLPASGTNTTATPDGGEPPAPPASSGGQPAVENPPKSDGQSRSDEGSSLRKGLLVSAQDPNATQPPDAPQPPDTAPTPPPVPADTPATQPPAADAPPAVAPTVVAPATEPPVTAPASTESTATASVPAEQSPVAGAAPAGPPSVAPAPPMRTQTLDEVREQMTRDMVIAVATEKMQAATKLVTNALYDHSEKMQMYYQSDRINDKSVERPSALDLEKLCKDNGLQYGRTGFFDFQTVDSLPLAKSFGRTGTFRDIALSGLGLFQVESTRAVAMTGITEYYFWKVDERKERLPELSEIESQVVSHWKRVEARKLAKERAEALVKQIEQASDAPWTSVLTETERPLVLTPPTFTWFQVMPPYYRPEISAVDELDTVGMEFMKSVYAAAPGKFIVAANQPETIYYVVRVIDKLPSEADLRSQFAAARGENNVYAISQNEARSYQGEWVREMDSELEVKWIVPPEVLQQLN